MNRLRNFGIISAFLAAAAANAGDKPIVYEKPYLFESYADGFTRMTEAAMNSEIENNKKLIAEQNALIKRAAEINSSLEAQRAAKTRLGADAAKLNAELQEQAVKNQQALVEYDLKAKHRAKKGFFGRMFDSDASNAHKTYADETKKLVGYEKESAETAEKLSNLETSIRSYESTQAKANAEAEAARAKIEAAQLRFRIPGTVQTLDQLRAYMEKDQLLRQAHDIGRAMFEKQKENHYDAKLLLSDLSVLKSQKKWNDFQLAGLKLAFDKQLDNTLLGQYVREQIGTAMKDICNVQAACGAKQAASIPAEVKQLMDRNRGAEQTKSIYRDASGKRIGPTLERAQELEKQSQAGAGQ
ncbi:MAG: hypothetical protein A2603_00535 [Bdellovibrionales bacterium RIFOXYD1_FULL_55_31]|nr:MAG: hypothetical protein A2603_00535 [Bdellovibrionales bacterium RIFOXYD1_FULL_55_31]